MNLSKLLPWNWLRPHGGDGGGAPSGAGRLRVVRAAVDENQGPAPGTVQAVHHELSRLFDHGFDGFGFSAPHLAVDDSGDAPVYAHPRTRAGSEADRHIYEADLPGVREQDISLTLKGRQLTVLAPRLAGQSGSSPGRAVYRATFELEHEADPDTIQASFQSFLLTIRVPRRPGADAPAPGCE